MFAQPSILSHFIKTLFLPYLNSVSYKWYKKVLLQNSISFLCNLLFLSRLLCLCDGKRLQNLQCGSPNWEVASRYCLNILSEECVICISWSFDSVPICIQIIHSSNRTGSNILSYFFYKRRNGGCDLWQGYILH